MIIAERVSTSASPDRVWEILSDPVMMELWNPKCEKCHTDAPVMTTGLSFEADFVLGRRKSRMACTVLECTSPTRLVIRHVSTDGNKHSVIETFNLVPSTKGTSIRQTIDLTRSGLPGWAQLVMKVLSLIGKKMGPGPVDGIKEQAESP